MVNSSVLPIEKEKGWETLKRWGVIPGEAVDNLFRECTLPPQWIKKSSDHSMWSYLCDDRGLRRASIFYKAAFYDRDAFININKRFLISRDHDAKPCDFNYVVQDQGLDRIIYRGAVGTYAFLSSNPGITGFLLNGVFHYAAEGEWDDARFTQYQPGELATLIDPDTFYKEYHHKTPCHEVINAADNLAHKECSEFLKSLPDDDSQWDAQWDLPVVHLEEA